MTESAVADGGDGAAGVDAGDGTDAHAAGRGLLVCHCPSIIHTHAPGDAARPFPVSVPAAKVLVHFRRCAQLRVRAVRYGWRTGATARGRVARPCGHAVHRAEHAQHRRPADQLGGPAAGVPGPPAPLPAPPATCLSSLPFAAMHPEECHLQTSWRAKAAAGPAGRRGRVRHVRPGMRGALEGAGRHLMQVSAGPSGSENCKT